MAPQKTRKINVNSYVRKKNGKLESVREHARNVKIARVSKSVIDSIKNKTSPSLIYSENKTISELELFVKDCKIIPGYFQHKF